MASMDEDRRVVLVGKTGNGKSSTGNAILGVEKFEAGKSLNAVTSICSVETSQRLNGRPIYKICDTPGFNDAGCNKAERSLEVVRSVTELCQNPHAFLFVFSSSGRFTEDENCTIDLLRVIFGEKVFDHCILVFTRGEEFDNEGQFKEFWTKCLLFTTLAAMCGNRVVRIENKPKNEESGLDKLLTMIEEVSNNGRKTYEYEEINEHVKGLTRARPLFDKKTEAWRNHVEKKEKIEYKTEKTKETIAFLRIMDITLKATVRNWAEGLGITEKIFMFGVKAYAALSVGMFVGAGVAVGGPVGLAIAGVSAGMVALGASIAATVKRS